MIGQESRGLGLFKGFIFLLMGVLLTVSGAARHLPITTSLGVICLIAAAGSFYFARKEGGTGGGQPPSRPDSS